jgi:hypothetical protein
MMTKRDSTHLDFADAGSAHAKSLFATVTMPRAALPGIVTRERAARGPLPALKLSGNPYEKKTGPQRCRTVHADPIE